MSDETKNPPEEVVLSIIWSPKDGRINVDGPIRNEPIAFWLLEKAKKIVEIANTRAAAPVIAPAPHGFDPKYPNRLGK